MLDTFLFDLDGTLLPMPDQKLFLDIYFKALSEKLTPYGYQEQKLSKAVWAGSNAMITNNGTMTNEQRFWDTFTNIMGEEILSLKGVFEEFYQNEFHTAQAATKTAPLAKECIDLLKAKGYHIILATNPVFPEVATYSRIAWAGLQPENFELITTYENSYYCKPNLEYYKMILKHCGKAPEQCYMVGNDVKEDMCAGELGMNTFLLNECEISSDGVNIADISQGGFDDLLEIIHNLTDLKAY